MYVYTYDKTNTIIIDYVYSMRQTLKVLGTNKHKQFMTQTI